MGVNTSHTLPIPKKNEFWNFLSSERGEKLGNWQFNNWDLFQYLLWKCRLRITWSTRCPTILHVGSALPRYAKARRMCLKRILSLYGFQAVKMGNDCHPCVCMVVPSMRSQVHSSHSINGLSWLLPYCGAIQGGQITMLAQWVSTLEWRKKSPETNFLVASLFDARIRSSLYTSINTVYEFVWYPSQY